MPLVAVLVLSVQAGVEANAPAPRLRGPVCASVLVSATGPSRPPRDLVFSARSILDLRFEGRLPTPPHGDHLLRFKVFTPSGFLYQVLTVSIKDATGHGRPFPRPGTGQAVPAPVQGRIVMPEESADNVRRDVFAATLPVAGTSITQSSLFGLWKVEPYLDDEPAACGPATQFSIRE